MSENEQKSITEILEPANGGEPQAHNTDQGDSLYELRVVSDRIREVFAGDVAHEASPEDTARALAAIKDQVKSTLGDSYAASPAHEVADPARPTIEHLLSGQDHRTLGQTAIRGTVSSEVTDNPPGETSSTSRE